MSLDVVIDECVDWAQRFVVAAPDYPLIDDLRFLSLLVHSRWWGADEDSNFFSAAALDANSILDSLRVYAAVSPPDDIPRRFALLAILYWMVIVGRDYQDLDPLDRYDR